MPAICYLNGDTKIRHVDWDFDLIQAAYDKNKSALRCVHCGGAMHPRQALNRVDHLVHFATSSCPLARKDPDRDRHIRVQFELLELGRLLGETQPEMEWSGGKGERYRFDVVWPRAKIAWEVDLSQNKASEQRHRQEVRHRHGFKMISLVEHLTKNTAREITTVRVEGLSTLGEGQRALRDRWVQNIGRFDAAGTPKTKLGRDFEAFVREMLAGKLIYAGLPKIRRQEPWYQTTIEHHSARYTAFRWLPVPVHTALEQVESCLEQARTVAAEGDKLTRTIDALDGFSQETKADLVSTRDKLAALDCQYNRLAGLRAGLVPEKPSHTTETKKHMAIGRCSPQLGWAGLEDLTRECQNAFTGETYWAWLLSFVTGRRARWLHSVAALREGIAKKVEEIAEAREGLPGKVAENSQVLVRAQTETTTRTLRRDQLRKEFVVLRKTYQRHWAVVTSHDSTSPRNLNPP